MDAVVLFLILGVAAGLAKSDLKLPAALYDALSIYLLLAIGLKGGMERNRSQALQPPALVCAVVRSPLVDRCPIGGGGA